MPPVTLPVAGGESGVPLIPIAMLLVGIGMVLVTYRGSLSRRRQR
jgi:hypothetical protein